MIFVKRNRIRVTCESKLCLDSVMYKILLLSVIIISGLNIVFAHDGHHESMVNVFENEVLQELYIIEFTLSETMKEVSSQIDEAWIFPPDIRIMERIDDIESAIIIQNGTVPTMSPPLVGSVSTLEQALEVVITAAESAEQAYMRLIEAESDSVRQTTLRTALSSGPARIFQVYTVLLTALESDEFMGEFRKLRNRLSRKSLGDEKRDRNSRKEQSDMDKHGHRKNSESENS